MAINYSGQFLYVTPIGGVYAGDSPPSGSTVLVCPGGTLSDELAARYKVTDRLKGHGDPPAPRDPAGNPIVVRGGKAIAASVLAADDPDRKAAEHAAKAEDDVKAKAKDDVKAKADDDEADDEPEPGLVVKADAESKAVHQEDVEDKAIHKPSGAAAKKPHAKPTPKGK